MGICYLKGKYLIGFPKALEPEEPDLNPYEDALVVLPFDGSIENVGVGADTYVPVANGTINYAVGIKNYAYNANNASRVEINSLATILKGDWTLCYWFKLGSNTSSEMHAVGETQNGASVMFGRFSTTGRFFLGQAGLHTIGTVSYQDDLWHFVVVEKQGDTLKAVIDNGAEILTNTNTLFSTGTVTVFAISSINMPFKGWLDNFCFWDRALSSAEIAWLYSDRTNYLTEARCKQIITLSGTTTDPENITDNDDETFGILSAGEHLLTGFDFSNIPNDATILQFTIFAHLQANGASNTWVSKIRKYTNGDYTSYSVNFLINSYIQNGVRTFTFSNGTYGTWLATDINKPYDPDNYSGFAFTLGIEGISTSSTSVRYCKVRVIYTLDGESLLSAESEMLMED
jgi:hypothetical protein